MNDLMILTKAIQKAQKNGYRYILSIDDENDKVYAKMLDLHKYFSIIFDHSFAKAFWGRDAMIEASRTYDKGLTLIESSDVPIPVWAKHLQQMALCEKPLEYIKYYLDE